LRSDSPQFMENKFHHRLHKNPRMTKF